MSRRLEIAARALLNAVDHQLDHDPVPRRYTVPWRYATELRMALAEIAEARAYPRRRRTAYPLYWLRQAESRRAKAAD